MCLVLDGALHEHASHSSRVLAVNGDRAPTQSFLGCEAGIQMFCSATSSVGVAMPCRTEQQKVLEALQCYKVSYQPWGSESQQEDLANQRAPLHRNACSVLWERGTLS